MDKELIELYEAAKKAADAVAVAALDGGVDSFAEEERCLDALKQLQKFPVNYHVLVSTQIGKRLRHLTKHPRKKIQAFASDLIEIWKNIIMEEAVKTKNNESLDNKDSVNAQLANKETVVSQKAQRVTSMKVEKVSEVETVKFGKINRSGDLKHEKVIKVDTVSVKRKVETVELNIEENTARQCVKDENITKEEKQTFDVRKPTPPIGPPKLSSVIKCKDAPRDKVRELLSEALLKVSSEADDDLRDEVNTCDPFRVAVSVESALFNKWGQSNGPQKFKYRSILFNIKDPKNPDFRRKVLLGHAKPENLPGMSPEEMASNQRQLENEKIKEKALFECQRAPPPKASTDQFRCGRCGKREVTYYQMQTRSADEPMTTFMTCVNCGKNWKFC